MDEWYISYYRTQYADSVRHVLTPERSQAEVEFILRETGVRPPAMVADVGCGEGRHSALFAARGLRVLGVDQNADFLAKARAATPAGAQAEYVVGDMRQALGGPFDLVLSLCHSFGFFDDAENARMLASWAGRLVSGGYFVLDVWNRDRIVRLLTPEHTWQASPELRVTDQAHFDPLTSRLMIHSIYAYTEGRQYAYDASFRLYTAPELRALLLASGLEVRAVYGSLTGGPFTLDAPRLVLVSRRERAAGAGLDVEVSRTVTSPRLPVVTDEERVRPFTRA